MFTLNIDTMQSKYFIYLRNFTVVRNLQMYTCMYYVAKQMTVLTTARYQGKTMRVTLKDKHKLLLHTE